MNPPTQSTEHPFPAVSQKPPYYLHKHALNGINRHRLCSALNTSSEPIGIEPVKLARRVSQTPNKISQTRRLKCYSGVQESARHRRATQSPCKSAYRPATWSKPRDSELVPYHGKLHQPKQCKRPDVLRHHIATGTQNKRRSVRLDSFTLWTKCVATHNKNNVAYIVLYDLIHK